MKTNKLKQYNFKTRIYLITVCLIVGWINVRAEDSIVAQFGKHQITLEEFKIAYLQLIKNPNVFDSEELRENFLDQLIQWRLLSEEAKKLNLDKNELVEYKLNSYRNKCLREEHFDYVIKPKIQISDADVEEAYMYTQEERRLSHLFLQQKSEADKLYQALENGASFDSLAKIVFSDTALANHGGDLGWISWDQFEYDLAMTAFRLQVNKYSVPVKSSYGYHILKVTDFKKRPMISRYEYEIHKRKVKYLLEYKIGKKLAFEYIDYLIKNDKVSIYPLIAEMVEQKLTEKFKRKPGQYDQMNDVQLKDEEIRIVETNLWDERDKILAVINKKNLTVGDFIGYLNFVPYQIIYNGMKNTLDYVIRDFLITQEAVQLGLGNSTIVKLKTQVYTENFLQLELRKLLVQSVKVDETELKKYYEDNKSKFKNETYEEMHNYIKNLVQNEKRSLVVPDYVKKLTGEMKIKKNLSVIHNYYNRLLNKTN